jgi:hypothetical protein
VLIGNGGLGQEQSIWGPRADARGRLSSLTSPATMSLVERQDVDWSLLALTVNPTERKV